MHYGISLKIPFESAGIPSSQTCKYETVAVFALAAPAVKILGSTHEYTQSLQNDIYI